MSLFEGSPFTVGIRQSRIATHAFNMHLTPLETQSRFGGKPVKLYVICPQNGAAVLKGLIENKNTNLKSSHDPIE